MYLEMGRYLLEGRLPYVDYIELNPPLIHYISVIPVFLADLTGINPIFAGGLISAQSPMSQQFADVAKYSVVTNLD